MVQRQPATRNAIPPRILATGIAASAVGLQTAYEHPVAVKQAANRQAQATAHAAKQQAAVAARAAKQIARNTASAARYAAHHPLRGATADSAAAANSSVAQIAVPGQADSYSTGSLANTPSTDSTIADLSAGSGSSGTSSGQPASSGVGSFFSKLSTAEKIGLGLGAVTLIVAFYYYRKVTAPLRYVKNVQYAGRNLIRAAKG